ncbi:hypothetical protein HQ544_02060 [Candidatus Falkowbacteria bacterium]|nr:hypothetical protein [Candidatus Falkowbacteria bacterium]
MSLLKSYNFGKYSILDIKRYLEAEGYKVEYKINELGDELHVIGTEVYVDVLPYTDINKAVLASIRFENYPFKENYDISKKIYGKLRDKFGRKEGEELPKKQEGVKDWVKVKEFVKQQKKDNKKSWWPL